MTGGGEGLGLGIEGAGEMIAEVIGEVDGVFLGARVLVIGTAGCVRAWVDGLRPWLSAMLGCCLFGV